jgi:uncharacterized protein GlcG (DUF336 family)
MCGYIYKIICKHQIIRPNPELFQTKLKVHNKMPFMPDVCVCVCVRASIIGGIGITGGRSEQNQKLAAIVNG